MERAETAQRVDPFSFAWAELPTKRGTFKQQTPRGVIEVEVEFRQLDQPEVYAAIDATGELEAQYITGEHPDNMGGGPWPIQVADRILTVSTPLIQQCVFMERMTTEASPTRWGWKEWAAASVTLPVLFKAASGFAQRLQREGNGGPKP